MPKSPTSNTTKFGLSDTVQKINIMLGMKASIDTLVATPVAINFAIYMPIT